MSFRRADGQPIPLLTNVTGSEQVLVNTVNGTTYATTIEALQNRYLDVYTKADSDARYVTTGGLSIAIGALGLSTMAQQNASSVIITGGTLSGVTASGVFTGPLTGNVTGNLSGNVTGNLTGNVTGNVSGTAANVTGVIALTNGGTGATTATTARTALGLGNVDNTSDANKPISTAQQTALTAKANLSGAAFTGAISATNLSGTNTGDQTNISGNAGTVSTINGLITSGTNVTITGNGTQASPYNIASSGGGAGSVIVTGSPAAGNLTRFQSPSAITNGDLSGDVTTAGTLATTLATTGVTAGTYSLATVTVDAKGRVTSASNGTAITPGGATTQIQYNNGGAFAGSSSFVWNNAANQLGIGTANPVSNLHVVTGSNGSSATPALTLSFTGTQYKSSLDATFSGTPANNILGFTVASGADTSVTPFSLYGDSKAYFSGNVGIGTTTPTSKLTVVSGTALTAADNFGGQLSLVGPATTSTDAMLSLAVNSDPAADAGATLAFGGKFSGNQYANWAQIRGPKVSAIAGDYGGYLSFWTRPSNNQMAERLRITPEGNVGIGTTAPASGLNYVAANADIRFSTGASGVTPAVSVISTNGKAAGLIAGTTGAAFVFDSAGDFYIGSNSHQSFVDNNLGAGGFQVLFSMSTFGNVSIPVGNLTVAGSGNTFAGSLGVGSSTSPAYTLDVTGDLRVGAVAGRRLILENATAAAAGSQQISPASQWIGQGWKTTATAASQTVAFQAQTVPVQGTTTPTGTWRLQSQINGGAWSDVMNVSDAGVVTATTFAGNASTATALATTRAFSIAGSTGLTASAINFNGTAPVALTLAGTLALANGGTGATTATAARTNLGLGTLATQNATALALTGNSTQTLGTATALSHTITNSGGSVVLGLDTAGNQNIAGSGTSTSMFISTPGNINFYTNSVQHAFLTTNDFNLIGTDSNTALNEVI